MNARIEIRCLPLPSHVCTSTKHIQTKTTFSTLSSCGRREGEPHINRKLCLCIHAVWGGPGLHCQSWPETRCHRSERPCCRCSACRCPPARTAPPHPPAADTQANKTNTPQLGSSLCVPAWSWPICACTLWVMCDAGLNSEAQAPHLIQDALQCGGGVHLRNVELLIIDLRSETDQRKEMREVWGGRGVSQLIIRLMGQNDSQELHGHLRGVFTCSRTNPDFGCVLSVIYSWQRLSAARTACCIVTFTLYLLRTTGRDRMINTPSTSYMVNNHTRSRDSVTAFPNGVVLP